VGESLSLYDSFQFMQNQAGVRLFFDEFEMEHNNAEFKNVDNRLILNTNTPVRESDYSWKE